MSDTPQFTIFTCTYNRAHTLVRTYQSLRTQSFTNFEWIVFDNGSTDNTRSLLRRWAKEAPFPIRILSWQDNTGFQRTFNEGLRVSRGEFWILLDSDDALKPHALERLLDYWNAIPSEQREQYVGITVNCDDHNGELVGDEFPASPLDSNALELTYHYQIRGEKWGFQRTNVLRHYPFPDIPQHVNPGIVWRAIARKYQTRYVNDSLQLYFGNEPGRTDNLNVQKTVMDFGKRLNQLDILNNYRDWLGGAPRLYLSEAMEYTRVSRRMGRNIFDRLLAVEAWSSRCFVLVAEIATLISDCIPDSAKRKIKPILRGKHALSKADVSSIHERTLESKPANNRDVSNRLNSKRIHP